MDSTLLVLRELAKRKRKIDLERNYGGADFYFEELKSEIKEVEEQLHTNNQVFLEDELGDILWDYMLVLVNLEEEQRINMSRVFARVEKKYTQRIEGVEQNNSWSQIKKEQKKDLVKEQKNLDSK